jgi:peptide/nickel transport system substrate-binding protein
MAGIWLVVAATAAALAAGVPGAGAAPEVSAELRVGAGKDIIALDPVRTNDADSVYIYSLIFDTVALIGPDGKVIPHLAERWTVSGDGLTYTYHLRRGVRFHNGDELTADDLVYSLRRIFDPANRIGRKWEHISMVKSYEKTGSHTVAVTLQFPYGAFPAAMGIQHVVSARAAEAAGRDFEKRPVGTGPFKFVERVPNDRTVLEANRAYWLKPPRVGRIVFRPIPEAATATAALLSGGVDIIQAVTAGNLKALISDPNIALMSAPANNYTFLGFRMLQPPFTDVRFRKAVYHSMNFDAVVGVLLPPRLGSRAYGSIPPALWPNDRDALRKMALKEDDAKAKELFRQLIAEGVMPRDYVVQIAPPPDDTRIRLSELLVANLIENGVNAQILRVDWPTYIAMLEQDRQVIYMLGTVPAYPDPDANIRWLFSSGGQQGRFLNIGKIVPGLDARLEQAMRSPNRPDREQLYRDIQREMMDRVMHIPLYYLTNSIAMRKWVKDLKPNPSFRWDFVTPWNSVYIEGR